MKFGDFLTEDKSDKNVGTNTLVKFPMHQKDLIINKINPVLN